jgi:low affinity Fe/Cu permease
MDKFFTFCAARISTLAGQPIAFVIAVLLIVIWGATGPIFHYSDTWQLVVNTATTIVTFLMLRAIDKAREQFIGIEHLTDQQIEDIRAALEREVGKEPGKPGTADDSVERLLDRY